MIHKVEQRDGMGHRERTTLLASRRAHSIAGGSLPPLSVFSP